MCLLAWDIHCWCITSWRSSSVSLSYPYTVRWSPLILFFVCWTVSGNTPCYWALSPQVWWAVSTVQMNIIRMICARSLLWCHGVTSFSALEIYGPLNIHLSTLRVTLTYIRHKLELACVRSPCLVRNHESIMRSFRTFMFLFVNVAASLELIMSLFLAGPWCAVTESVYIPALSIH